MTTATNKQVPDHAIVDQFNKQAYLANGYVYALNTEITTTAEYPLILLKNPAVSATGFPSGYISTFLNLKSLICLTASQSAIIRVYLSPTFSAAGTAATAVNQRVASVNTSTTVLTTAPTVSVNGTLIDMIASNNQNQRDFSQLMTIIDPGKTLLFTVQTTSSSTYIATALSFYEI